MTTFNIKVSKEGRRSIFVTGLLLLIGYGLALFMCEPVMFARFGSLIVCVGVLFSIKGLPETLDSIQPIFQSEIDLLKDKMEQLCVGHPSEGALRKSFKEIMDPKISEIEKRMNRTIFSQKKRLLHLEGGIVIIGTLIWGFGDFAVPSICEFCV
jgi:hypothetical protein